MPTRRTDSFPARGDDGRDYIIDIYTDFARAPSPEDPHAETAGLQSLRLRDRGTPVHWKEKGVYETSIGLILRSDAPNAP
jgi:hypothetical protein